MKRLLSRRLSKTRSEGGGWIGLIRDWKTAGDPKAIRKLDEKMRSGPDEKFVEMSVEMTPKTNKKPQTRTKWSLR